MEQQLQPQEAQTQFQEQQAQSQPQTQQQVVPQPQPQNLSQINMLINAECQALLNDAYEMNNKITAALKKRKIIEVLLLIVAIILGILVMKPMPFLAIVLFVAGIGGFVYLNKTSKEDRERAKQLQQYLETYLQQYQLILAQQPLTPQTQNNTIEPSTNPVEAVPNSGQ